MPQLSTTSRLDLPSPTVSPTPRTAWHPPLALPPSAVLAGLVASVLLPPSLPPPCTSALTCDTRPATAKHVHPPQKCARPIVLPVWLQPTLPVGNLHPGSTVPLS